MDQPNHLIPVMNNTKWDELRKAMDALGSIRQDLSTVWRTRCWENGYTSSWDADWFYHFLQGSYECIEWVEIKLDSELKTQAVRSVLAQIHVPIENTTEGIRVYGYIKPGQYVEYAAP
jgi:hypothetical protein